MLQTIRRAIFIFLILTQTVFAGQRLALMGDAGRASPALNALKQSVLRSGVRSIVMPGDNLYSGTYEKVWDSWKSEGLNFDIVAIGNHHGGYQKEIDYFRMPGEYYAVVKGGARFLVLNSDNTRNIPEQFSWLEKQIDSAREELIFLVYHHPTYTVTRHSHTWQEKKKFQMKMRDFLKRYESRLTAAIVGHDHMTSLMAFDSLPVIVAGSGREVRNEKPVAYTENGVSVQSLYLAPRTQHWALLEISANAQQAEVHIVRVSDQKKVCTAWLKRALIRLDKNCY